MAMQQIKVTAGPVWLPAGCRLLLTAEQAAARASVLQPESGGYLTLARTQWKTGEELSTDAELIQALLACVELLESETSDAPEESYAVEEKPKPVRRRRRKTVAKDDSDG